MTMMTPNVAPTIVPALPPPPWSEPLLPRPPAVGVRVTGVHVAPAYPLAQLSHRAPAYPVEHVHAHAGRYPETAATLPLQSPAVVQAGPHTDCVV
jgi:hypothetical protein